jgi:hypothetical protein
MAGRALSLLCRKRTRAALALASLISCDQTVLDQTYRPEEASASDVADMWMAVKMLVQELSQVLSVFADVFHQVLFLHDLLDFQGAGAAHRVTLVGVTVGEGTGYVRLSTREWIPCELTRFPPSTHLLHGG